MRRRNGKGRRSAGHYHPVGDNGAVGVGGDRLDFSPAYLHVVEFHAEVIGYGRPGFANLLSVHIELHEFAVGVDGDHLFLPEIPLPPEMGLDMHHGGAGEVRLPEIIDVFRGPPAVYPSFGIDVLEGSVGVFAVRAVVGIEPDCAVVLADGAFAVPGNPVLPVLGAGPLPVGRLVVGIILVVPALNGASQITLHRHFLVGVAAEFRIVGVVIGLADGNYPGLVFFVGETGVAGIVGLVAHAPNDYARMVPVPAYHLAAVLLLHGIAEVLVLYVREFLVDADAVMVHECVNRWIVGIVGGAHVVDVQPVLHILHIPLCNPLREGLAEPYILLVPVDSVQVDGLSVKYQAVDVVVPFHCPDTEFGGVSVCYLSVYHDLADCGVEARSVRRPECGLLDALENVAETCQGAGGEGFGFLVRSHFFIVGRVDGGAE